MIYHFSTEKMGTIFHIQKFSLYRQTISGHGQDVTKPLLHIGGQTSESDDAASETKYGTSHNKRWSTQPGPSFKVPPRVPPKPSNL